MRLNGRRSSTPAARDRVLARMAARAPTNRRAARTYLLAGLRRAHCGNRLHSHARHSNPDNRVRRYACAKGPDHRGCGRLTGVAEPVEELLTAAMPTRLDSTHLAEVLAGAASADQDVAALAAQIDADQERLDELAGLHADGLISAREWIAARNRITDRITAARLRPAPISRRGHPYARCLHCVPTAFMVRLNKVCREEGYELMRAL